MPSVKKKAVLFFFGLLHGIVVGWFLTRQTQADLASVSQSAPPSYCPPEGGAGDDEEGYYEEGEPEDDHVEI